MAEAFDREDVETVAACLGDDAAQLREENDEDERADNLDRAASMLTWMLLTHPAFAAAPMGKEQSLEELCTLTADEWRETAEKAEAELAAIAHALPGTTYMDPPDGGAPTLAEQVRRMAKDAARYLWLRSRPGLSVFTGERIRFRPFDAPHEIEVGQIGATDLDEAIDAQLTHGVKGLGDAQQ